MYLSDLKLWNFRKYGNASGVIDVNKPDLHVEFIKGLNVLIGENDSGKTAILDAIRLVLRTHSYERTVVEYDDFHTGSNEFRIEIFFKDFNELEASHFIEWIGFDSITKKATLRLVYVARIVDSSIIHKDVQAGLVDDGSIIYSEAREYLKVTYLKPLRDAESELVAKKNSRLSQILVGHELFKDGADGNTQFVDYVSHANDSIRDWFDSDDKTNKTKSNKEQIKGVIDRFLGEFINNEAKSNFVISGSTIREILENISIEVKQQPNLGLGTLNRLYMATELLHLQKENWSGLRLCLIEELEAHLHPQAQMKVIKALQNEKEQFIITTHSPNLASKIKLASELSQVLLCKGTSVFSLREQYTMLDKNDYTNLQNFLDVTKANLFFAKGIILVEGWAEEVLLPSIAKKIGCDLADYEVSIVNVGSTAYMKYARIFMQKNKTRIGIPVSIVTDLDVRPDDRTLEFNSTNENEKSAEIKSRIDTVDYPDIKWNIAPHWTLEWCLYKSQILGKMFRDVVSQIYSKTLRFKKNDEGKYNDDEFAQELSERLKKYYIDSEGKKHSKDGLDKVEIAYKLAELIDEAKSKVNNEDGEAIDFAQNDFDGIDYLKDAIKHACGL